MDTHSGECAPQSNCLCLPSKMGSTLEQEFGTSGSKMFIFGVDPFSEGNCAKKANRKSQKVVSLVDIYQVKRVP